MLGKSTSLRSKCIDTWFHFIPECDGKNEVKVKFMKTHNQVADIFTKALKYDTFNKLLMLLRVIKN